MTEHTLNRPNTLGELKEALKLAGYTDVDNPITKAVTNLVVSSYGEQGKDRLARAIDLVRQKGSGYKNAQEWLDRMIEAARDQAVQPDGPDQAAGDNEPDGGAAAAGDSQGPDMDMGPTEHTEATSPDTPIAPDGQPADRDMPASAEWEQDRGTGRWSSRNPNRPQGLRPPTFDHTYPVPEIVTEERHVYAFNPKKPEAGGALNFYTDLYDGNRDNGGKPKVYEPCVMLDAAAQVGSERKYDFSKDSKIVLKLDPDDIPPMAAVFAGLRSGFETKAHGPNNDKGVKLALQDQTDRDGNVVGKKVYTQVFARGRSVAVPVGGADRTYVGAIFVAQVIRLTPGVTNYTDALNLLRTTQTAS